MELVYGGQLCVKEKLPGCIFYNAVDDSCVVCEDRFKLEEGVCAKNVPIFFIMTLSFGALVLILLIVLIAWCVLGRKLKY